MTFEQILALHTCRHKVSRDKPITPTLRIMRLPLTGVSIFDDFKFYCMGHVHRIKWTMAKG